jgi:hypothetical protein
MRILLSLLLLFGCGEDGDTDQQSELGSYESIDCVDRGSSRGRSGDLRSVIIEGVHPVEVHIVFCGHHPGLMESDDVKVCGDPMDMLYRDGSIEVYCSLETRIGHTTLAPHSESRSGDGVVYYKKL